MIANASSTQMLELTNSWLQSIDERNAPVFTPRHLLPAGASLRRSYRRTAARVADTRGSNGEQKALWGSD
ncbi:hypothetical protein MAGR_02670 [Mycolicibacterium agri]|uniref:Uncharacterized protein n=1 Tax=Mycolicibacterium agri TaxID=36811 RepID=A0A7I9VV51_MYCAG|nr:hypothetical protein MAGR_02670 [Mycolicibacterium agri]